MEENKGYKVPGYSVMTEEERKNLYIEGYSRLSDEEKELLQRYMENFQNNNKYEVFFKSVRRPNKKDDAPRACLVVDFERRGYEEYSFVTSTGEYF